jgi:hypothetical protein
MWVRGVHLLEGPSSMGEETPCTTAAARRRLLRGPQRPGGARRVTHGAGAGGAAARGVGSARLRDRLATRIIII